MEAVGPGRGGGAPWAHLTAEGGRGKKVATSGAQEFRRNSATTLARRGESTGNGGGEVGAADSEVVGGRRCRGRIRGWGRRAAVKGEEDRGSGRAAERWVRLK